MRSSEVTIYVYLLDEGVDVWIPVLAEKLSETRHRIADQPYDRATQRWEFEPGAVVVCESKSLSGGSALVATRLSSER